MGQMPRELTPYLSAAHFFGAELRHWRTRSGYSQDELGSLVHVSGDLIGKVEKASRWPAADLAERCDALLGTGGTLRRIWPLVEQERQSRRRDAGHAQCHADNLAGSSIKRDHTARLDETIADIAARMQRLATTNVNEETLHVFELAAEEITGRYELEGPVRLMPAVVALRRRGDELLSGQQHPLKRLRLYSLAGRLSALLGYMAINRGRFGLADAYCREAMTLAEQAGDEGLQAWVRGTQSFGAYYAGDFPRALDFARGGLRHANGGPQAVRLLINGVARALGKMGDARGVIETVAEAYKVLEGTRVPDGLSPCISLGPYSAARVAANAATAFLALGDVDRVLEFAGQVEELVEASESDWSRALVRIDVATALLRSASPEVEHAMELGTEALAATAGKPIRSVWQRLRELDIQASPWSQEPEVREFDEHLRSWMSQPEHQAACGDQELTTR